ncbi:hypothetical protein [Dehalococcoides mccartyi]|uniref:Uncharacterized protein n=1 Tax=Dehalococcoides mccartyi (strain CBDB1) TaxID=255470 RepID=A0A916NUT9_DEHMC|nr:hypothetical protein [Dehalococcoides mccartyi]CAI82873.1 hypothetical protein cbdbA712 [Dehalococcoides mccartyi CBDB1]
MSKELSKRLKAEIDAILSETLPPKPFAGAKHPIYGITMSGKWCYRYKGSNPDKKRLAAYCKAQDYIQRELRKAEEAQLAEIFYPAAEFLKDIQRGDNPSYLQRIALAFHNHNWELLRSAVLDYVNFARAEANQEAKTTLKTQPLQSKSTPDNAPANTSALPATPNTPDNPSLSLANWNPDEIIKNSNKYIKLCEQSYENQQRRRYLYDEIHNLKKEDGGDNEV